MSPPKSPRGGGPGDTSHHHEGWLESLSNMGFIHRGLHLPYAKIFLTLTFLGGAAAAAVLFLTLLGHWEDRRESARERGQIDAAAAARFMDGQLEEIVSVATHIANFDLTEGRSALTRDGEDSIESRLKYLLEENPGFWGVGACFERADNLTPLADSVREELVANGRTPDPTGEGLYCPYYTRPGGVITFTPVNYDYTDSGYFLPGAEQPRGSWYQRPRDGGAQWNSPYFGTTSRRMVAEYVIPFFDSDEARADDLVAGRTAGLSPVREASPTGVVFVNFTLDQISGNVSWLNLGGRGYGFLVAQDEDGTYVAHPDESYYSDPERQRTGQRQRSLDEMADELDSDGLREILRLRGDCADPENVREGGYVDYRDELTGRDAWIFYEPVESACWTLGSVVVKSEVLGRDSKAHRLLLWISAALMVTVFSLVALLLRIQRGDRWFSWSVVITFSVLCAAGVGWVWWLARTTPQVEAGLDGDGQSLVEIVNDYESRVRQDEHLSEVTPVFAGVSLASVEDAGDGDLVVSGITWQRYVEAEEPVPDDPQSADDNDDQDGPSAGAEEEVGPPNVDSEEPDTSAGFEPGFVFSDDPAATSFELRYEESSGNSRIIGWSFRTVVKGPSNVTQYPFDRGEVDLRLAPTDIDDPVILIPDLPEYTLTVPLAKPGIGDGFDLPGWNIERSYFGYAPNPNNSSLGIPDFSVREDEPQLVFTTLFARDSVSPFITRMLPVIVVSILVFCLFLIVSRTRLRPEDFSPTMGLSSLAFLSALMFVLILGHNGLRSELGTASLIYLEYFYIIMYVAVLFVAIRVISMIYGVRVGWTYYRSEFTLERLYWPLVTLATLVTTWLAFY